MARIKAFLKDNRQELWVYALLWGLLFMAPVVAHYVSTDHNGSQQLEWADVLHVWRHYAIFFAVFLVHNFLLAPLLVERQRRWLYFSTTAMLLAAFTVVQCSQHPDLAHHDNPAMDMREHHGMPPRGDGPDAAFRPDSMHRPGDLHQPDGMGPRPDRMPHPGGGGEAEFRPDGDRPPFIFAQHDVVAVIVLILMLGMNVGVKLYFRQQRDRRRMESLEKQSLEQQLQYLRYQVNPHFLMNTLNNIHALVDIDGERAKESIIELSKIMRFVLYDGAKTTVALSRELAFVEDYIRLMRMRLTDRVSVSVSLPAQVPDAQVPPLLLITFVENAFKHGVSYRQESFIDISATVSDGSLRFSCRNSKIPQADDQHGGVGLKNARQRLDLIYGQRYRLDINDQPSEYNILLEIPLS